MNLRALLLCLVLLLVRNYGVSQQARRLPKALPAGGPVDTTVCVLARDQSALDAQTVLRVRGRIYRVFDELVIRNNLCRLALELPRAMVIGSRDKQPTPEAASPSGVTSGVSKGDENLRTLMRYVDARVAPVRKGAACLVCGRYDVRATVVGHLEVAGKPGVDGPEKPGAKSTTRHLVIRSVSNVKAKDLWGTLYSRDKYKPVPPN